MDKLQSKVREKLQGSKQKRGSPIRPSAAIWESFSNEILREIDLFWRDIERSIKREFSGTIYAEDSITPQARIMLNQLLSKWGPRFNTLAKEASAKMIRRVERNAIVGVNQSLREVSKQFEIDTSKSDERLKDIIQASTQEAVNLIKRIPEKYLNQVQGEVMRSITTGSGMKDLVPYLAKEYKGNVRWARHVAMDQTRKAHAAISTHHLKKFGVESFIWRHTGGSRYPRKDHIELSGKEFRFDDPPVINKRTGERGLPSFLPFCRCVSIPVLRFAMEEG